MSKSKKQRQQQKQQQMQSQKKQKPVQATEKMEKKQETESSSRNQENQTEPEIRMNFYSGMSMLTTVISAVSAVLAMIVAGRGLYYVLQAIYDETAVDILLCAKNLTKDGYGTTLTTYLYIIGILLALVVIVSLIQTVKAMNSEKKPVPFLSVLSILFCLAALILYFMGNKQVDELAAMFEQFAKNTKFVLYNAYPIVIAANLLCVTGNLAGQIYGSNLYKKTGKTC